jgi:hypothetical protein
MNNINYKIAILDFITNKASVIKRINDETFIPVNNENKDYVHFKKEINEEKAELQDADGNTMTAAEAKSFVATLP